MGIEKQWVYVNISAEQIALINQLIAYALGRGIHRSRPNLVAEALAEYIEKPENQEKLHSVSR